MSHGLIACQAGLVLIPRHGHDLGGEFPGELAILVEVGGRSANLGQNRRVRVAPSFGFLLPYGRDVFFGQGHKAGFSMKLADDCLRVLYNVLRWLI